ncbi:MAG: energy-coupling factor ABC transporter ATP-binding protein [Thermoflexales bacterium]|nr:energy-coupling factor ABC transporter ATP-binding protein [Thermoflexales bacterium]
MRIADLTASWFVPLRYTVRASVSDAITVTQLSYTYANQITPALAEISARLRAGELTLIVGRSGSGKTTLARCINGLIPHSYKGGTLKGQLRYFDEDLSALSLAQRAQRIGTVMQDPDKQIVATRVFDEIAFGLENLGLPREAIVERVHAVAAQLRIAHLLERKTHTLSGGELQRVAIASVVAMQPRVLLLDEPLASLDPPAAHQALGLFRLLTQRGMAVVMIEHRVREALALAPEHCLVLDQGRLTFDSSGSAFALQQRRRSDEAALDRAPRRRHGQGRPLLVWHDVTFKYPDSARPQVDRVNIAVHEGEIVALLGANGAGKSTLCRLAIGLLRPQQGRVLVEGEDAARLSTAQIAQRVGYVFQNPTAMLFAENLAEELRFGPRNVGFDAATTSRAVADALATVGLEALDLSRSPFSLSFGQQRRLAIAAVLAMQPSVLILDEPTAGLDEESAEALMARLAQLEPAPRAMVVITHDVRLAWRFATRVVLLRAGAVIADGPTEVVLNQPALLREAQLLVD